MRLQNPSHGFMAASLLVPTISSYVRCEIGHVSWDASAGKHELLLDSPLPVVDCTDPDRLSYGHAISSKTEARPSFSARVSGKSRSRTHLGVPYFHCDPFFSGGALLDNGFTSCRPSAHAIAVRRVPPSIRTPFDANVWCPPGNRGGNYLTDGGIHVSPAIRPSQSYQPLIHPHLPHHKK